MSQFYIKDQKPNPKSVDMLDKKISRKRLTNLYIKKKKEIKKEKKIDLITPYKIKQAIKKERSNYGSETKS